MAQPPGNLAESIFQVGEIFLFGAETLFNKQLDNRAYLNRA